MSETMAMVALLIGVLFMLLAAVGLIRLPDAYMRLQAVSKAGTMGTAWLMLAVAIHFGTVGGILRAAAIFAFIYFTAPVSAHLIGRAAYLIGAPLRKGVVVDEMVGQAESIRKQWREEAHAAAPRNERRRASR